MKHSLVVPAILQERYTAIESKMRQVSTLVPLVQVDITDGIFVPSRSYARSGQVAALERLKQAAVDNQLELELDLMVDLDHTKAMRRWSESLIQAAPERVVFHLGSTYRWDELFEELRSKSPKGQIPFRCGLAVRVSHTRNEIRKILNTYSEFEYIQIMGIERVGYSGEKLSSKIYDRIRRIRRAFGDIPIQIDGGVKAQHAKKLIQAGADRLGMNSGMFKTDDIRTTIKQVEEQV